MIIQIDIIFNDIQQYLLRKKKNKKNNYQKKKKMNQIFYDLKSKKCMLNEQTNHDNQQKLVSSIDSLNSSENNQGNQNEFFEIKSLILNSFEQNQKKNCLNHDQLQKKVQQKKNHTIITQNKIRKLKKQKTLKLQTIFHQYYSYFSQTQKQIKLAEFFTYSRRRNSHHESAIQNKIDLGVYNLLEIIQFCVDKKIISSEIYLDFTFHTVSHLQQHFIQKLNKKQFQLIDFQKIFFTPIDHRLLCKILCIKYPSIYKYPHNLTIQNKKKTIFYNFLYWLPQTDYQQIYLTLNLKFLRTWMPQNLTQFIDTLTNNLTQKSSNYSEQLCEFQLPNRKLRKKF